MRFVQIGELSLTVKSWNPAAASNEETFTYIDISSVSQERKLVEVGPPILTADAPSRARQLVETDDILVSTVRPNLNAVARVLPEHDGATASTGFCVLRPEKSLVDPAYLFHWVRSPEFVSEMVKLATGQSYPAVSDKIIKGSKIPLPPLEEQKRIAAILDQADALGRLRARALTYLDALELSFLNRLYRDQDSTWLECEFKTLAEDSRNSFCNGPFGSDLLTSELTDDGVPVIYIRDIAKGRYMRKSEACVTAAKAKALAACAVASGDLLIAKVGDPPCMSAVYPEGEPDAIITQDVIRIRPKRSLAEAAFLSVLLNSEFGKQKIKAITVQATRARVSLKDLKSMKLTIPPIDVQRNFVKQIEGVQLIRQSYVSAISDQNSLFTSLQHRAFRGDL